MTYRLLIAALVCTAALLQAAQQPHPATPIQQAIKKYLTPDAWSQEQPPDATREDLVDSVIAARKYFLAQQKKDGNFTYALDIASGDTSDDDNQVRQAGALWGLVRIHQAFPTPDTQRAILRGLDFVSKNTRQVESGETVFIYPGDQVIRTGTIALLVLAITDFLEDKTLAEDNRQHYRRLLFSYIHYLQTMEMADGSWARHLDVSINFRDPQHSAYYDGEALLAYTRAQNALNRKDLLKRINDALPKLIARYTTEAWAPGGDEETTKGFYQWGSMAFEQYIAANRTPHAQLARDAAFALAIWQIHRNKLEDKRGNNAYALEGMAAAYHIATLTNDTTMQNIIGPVAKRLIARLTLCQFDGPFMKYNHRFNAIKTPAPGASGGITDTPDGTIVRIDVVQHQAHAALLMLQWLYPAP